MNKKNREGLSQAAHAAAAKMVVHIIHPTDQMTSKKTLYEIKAIH